MAIDIRHLAGSHFEVELTPPHGEWHSASPLTATQVLAELSRLGCHSTDITDALDASGAGWRPGHNAEVERRRDERA